MSCLIGLKYPEKSQKAKALKRFPDMSWKVFDAKRFQMVVKGVQKDPLKGLEISLKGPKNVLKCKEMHFNFCKIIKISPIWNALRSCCYTVLILYQEYDFIPYVIDIK